MMVTVMVELRDAEVDRLSAEARRRGVSLEDLIKQGVDAVLAERQARVEAAAQYVLEKNDELYRRLA